MQQTSLLHLPTETIMQIGGEAQGEDPLRNLRGLLGTSQRLNSILRPLAYGDVALFQLKPSTRRRGIMAAEPFRALDAHTALLDSQPDIGQHVRTLSFEATSVDASESLGNCSAVSEEAIIAFCARTPQLNELHLRKCFVLDSAPAKTITALNSVTHLALSQAVFLGHQPTPATIARHFVDLQKLSIGIAAHAYLNPTFVAALRDEVIDVRALVLEPSYPFPTQLAEALLEATLVHLDECTIYLPLIAAPDDYMIPDNLQIHPDSNISRLEIVLPLCLFPVLFDVRDTWDFLTVIVMSAPPTTRDMRFVFDAGRMPAYRAARRMGNVPVALVACLLNELGPSIAVTFDLRVAHNRTPLSWDDVTAAHPEWLEVKQRDTVSLESSTSTRFTPSFDNVGRSAPPARMLEEEYFDWLEKAAVWTASDSVSHLTPRPSLAQCIVP